jgi:hypothetical protein
MQAALSALSTMAISAREPEPWQLLTDGQRCAARVRAFLDQALGALHPSTGTLPPRSRSLLERYHAPGRVLVAMEGGCTRVGWQARIEAQRLAGVRAMYTGIGAALADDLEHLVDLGRVLDEQLPKHSPARRHLEAFHLGLERLIGLIELLADTQTRGLVHRARRPPLDGPVPVGGAWLRASVQENLEPVP